MTRARTSLASLAKVAGFTLSCAVCASASLGGAQWGGPPATPGAAGVDEKLLEARSTLDRGRVKKAELEQSLAAIAPRKATLKQRVVRDARSLYRISRGGMLPVAGGMDAMLGHASRVNRLERIVAAEAAELASLDRKKLALRKELSEWELRMADAEREVATLEQARLGLAQQQATQALFDAAFHGPSAQPTPSANRVSYGLSLSGGGIAHEPFADQRGNLALPVSGPLSIQEARRAESDGPGLAFAGTPGTAIRAAAAGRVAFAERYGSYGQLVILDHGDRYYSVYGGFARIEVQVGDDVSKSARLGSASGDPVYFEVRRGTKTQDARGWLGL